MAIVAAREGLAFETTVPSDSACLIGLVDALHLRRASTCTMLRGIQRAAAWNFGFAAPARSPRHRGRLSGNRRGACASRADDVRAACRAVLGLGAPSMQPTRGPARPSVPAEDARSKRPSVIWLQLQECTGCVESVLRTADPTIGDLLLDVISLDYNHTLMAGAGAAVERAKQAGDGGEQGQVSARRHRLDAAEGRRHVHDDRRTHRARVVLEEAAEGAAAILALGACAHWGSVQAARPNPDRRRGRARRHQEQADREHRGLPADRRRRDRDRRALPHVRPAARRRRRGTAAVRVRQAHPRPVLAPRALRRRPVRRSRSTTRRRARAGACTRWAARARRRSRRARSSSGTRARAGPSAPDIRASAAPSRTSGTR